MQRRLLLLFLAVLLLGTGCNREKPSANSKPESQQQQQTTIELEEELVELNDRQKEILKSGGLPENYSELNTAEKTAIISIEQMLEYMEKKYDTTFYYQGYVTGNMSLEPETLTCFAEGSSDIVTVTREYTGGAGVIDPSLYEYRDDYREIQLSSIYQKELVRYVTQIANQSQYVVVCQVTEINEDCTEDSILKNAAAIGYVYLNAETCSEECAKNMLETWVADRLADYSGMGSMIYLYLLDGNTMETINEYNHVRVVQSAENVVRITCSVTDGGTSSIN